VNTASVETTAPLLFNWEPPRQRKRAIVGFLGAAAIAHAVCFYIFQIVYPPAVTLLPPPARVSVISPLSEEGRSFLRWIDAEDPALASATQRPAEGKLRTLPKLEHVPSYLAEEPALKEAPPFTIEPPALSSQPPAPVPIPSRPSVPAVAKAPTHVFFSKELDNLGEAVLPSPHFAASSTEPPQSMRFRIAVSPMGEIRYCFLLNSSGDSSLDEQARQRLARSRFPARAMTEERGGQSLVWGVAIIEWGNDVAGALPKSTASP
jgi:hypothetical protein